MKTMPSHPWHTQSNGYIKAVRKACAFSAYKRRLCVVVIQSDITTTLSHKSNKCSLQTWSMQRENVFMWLSMVYTGVQGKPSERRVYLPLQRCLVFLVKRHVVVVWSVFRDEGFGLPGVISSQCCRGNCGLNGMLTTIVKTTLKFMWSFG